MLTTVTFGKPNGLRLVPSMVAANERYLQPDELTFSIPESYAGDIEVGMPVFFSWFPEMEFLIQSISIGAQTCDLVCANTETILGLRPAVPDIRSNTWKEVEYPDGWEFGDSLEDVDIVPLKTIIDEVWNKSTKWYQNSGYNTGSRDLVADFIGDFTQGITGSIYHYVVDGSLYDTILDIIGLSTTRTRLVSRMVRNTGGYTVRFYTEPCRDKVRNIRITNYRSDVRGVKTSIDISSTPNTVIRANEDGVSLSSLYTPTRNYVTINHSSAKDDDMGYSELTRSFQGDLIYNPYSELSQGYSVEFEFHGELDLTGLKPGDTVVTDSTHPRPSWIPEQLMISEIVRTYDHLGYREYPLLTPVPAVYGRDNSSTIAIKQTLRNYEAN